MRGLILCGVVALALMVPLGPGREASADALCAPYGSAWNRAKASGSLSAMDQVIAQIPASCSRELTNAKSERAEIVRQRAAEKARQEELARQARLRAEREEAIRQAELRAAREEAARIAAKKRDDEEKARAEAAKLYNIKICNRSGEPVFIAVGYHPPSNNNIWNFSGWYKQANDQCHSFTTDYETFFYYAANDEYKSEWKGKEKNYCVDKTDPFEFTINAPAGKTCDGNLKLVEYLTRTATDKNFTIDLTSGSK